MIGPGYNGFANEASNDSGWVGKRVSSEAAECPPLDVPEGYEERMAELRAKTLRDVGWASVGELHEAYVLATQRIVELEARFNEGETCQVCGTLYRDEYWVSDELWARITPKPESPKAGLLCPNCALKRTEEVMKGEAE